MTFKVEDVKIDIYRTGGKETYRMTHKPSGAVVIGMGNPQMNNRQKVTCLDELKALVAKFDAKKRTKQKP